MVFFFHARNQIQDVMHSRQALYLVGKMKFSEKSLYSSSKLSPKLGELLSLALISACPLWEDSRHYVVLV